jgi:hypothetical protein
LLGHELKGERARAYDGYETRGLGFPTRRSSDIRVI